MAPHSSTLAWKIPWMEEPGGRQSMGSLRVRQDSATSLSLFTFLHWRRQWQPTPVFLPGESQGWGSLVGYHLWGHTESDTTEATQQQQQQQGTKTLNKWKTNYLMKQSSFQREAHGLIALRTREAGQVRKLLRLGDHLRHVKGMETCTHPDPYQQPALELLL